MAGRLGDDLLLGGEGDDTYLLTPAGGSLDVLEDPAGSNTLDFSGADAGISIDLDTTSVQDVTPGGRIRLDGTFANAIGSTFDDVFHVDAQPFARHLEGGPPGVPVGDTLHFDARSGAVVLTPTAISSLGFAPTTYSGMETIDIVNAGGSVTPRADLALDPVGTPGPATVDGRITLDFTLTNRGPSPAADTVLTITLPAGLSAISVGATRGVFQVSGGLLTNDLEAVDPGEVVRIRLVVEVSSPSRARPRTPNRRTTSSPGP